MLSCVVVCWCALECVGVMLCDALRGTVCCCVLTCVVACCCVVLRADVR